MRVPRLVVAGTHSGAGKTTVATGLMAALRRRGRKVAAFKAGPDFIDPSYHRLATGRPGRNLDAWISGSDAVLPLFLHGAAGCDVAVVEGVMGLYDGAGGEGETASTAHVAKLLAAPVILVVDASAMSRSVAALVAGYRDYDPGVSLAGVVLNRVGSPSHADLLGEALAGVDVPVLGCLREDEAFAFRERHLGLVPVVEDPVAVGRALERLATAIEAAVDVTAVAETAAAVLPLVGRPWSPEEAVTGAREGDDGGNLTAPPRPVRVGVAAGRAFSFYYPENLEVLTACGAELVQFDPTVDAALPEGVAGLYLGGGFPEVYAADLAANEPLRDAVVAAVGGGTVTWAECGGLLYLCRSLDGRDMCGVLPLAAEMGERLHLGYREARALMSSPLAGRGERARGHEFHYTDVVPLGGVAQPLWELAGRAGVRPDGHATGTLAASYLHLHVAADPRPAARFVATAARRGAG